MVDQERMDKDRFGIFSPVSGIKKNVPTILTLTPDNINVLLKDGKILRRKMREPTLLDDDEVKVQTPDANPIIHYHNFVKRSTGTEYLLAFTKAHIYHWNPSTKVFDLKFTCSADCENWETVSYNDKVIATNNVDKVLVWDTTGDFVALDDITNGIEYSRGYSNETNVDETSAKDQKVLKVTSTSGYASTDKVIIDRGGDREEEGVVDSVQAGESLTLVDVLTYDHTVDAKTTVDDFSGSGVIATISLGVGGTDYTAEDVITIVQAGGSLGTVRVDTVDAGVITAITLLAKGSGYAVENGLSVTGGTGSGATINILTLQSPKLLNVASTTGFSEDEFVTINAGGDRAETRKIYTIQDGVSLTFTVDLTYAHTQAQGDEVVGSLGQEDKVEEYTSYYLTKAKHLTVFENYLILGNTYENDSYHYQRARWSSIGEEANWLTGTRGSMEVGQSDKITGFGHYQGFLIIFKESSYFKVWLVGIPYIFNKIRLSKEIGCQCSHSIINDSKGRLYFFSSEGTFKEITAGTISDDIQTDIIAKIQPDYVELIKGAFINETEEVWWSIPVESDKNNRVVVFKEGKWLILDLTISAFGEFKEE